MLPQSCLAKAPGRSSSTLFLSFRHLRRSLTTTTTISRSKREGDISDAFTSLSGGPKAPLPDRFRQLKCDLARGREADITASWGRLLRALRHENEIVASKGPSVIPQIEYSGLDSGLEAMGDEIRKRGAVVIRGVVPEAEARAYKEEIEDYVRKNPSTRGESASNVDTAVGE